MEMNEALAQLLAAGIGFEVVYEGDDAQCPQCDPGANRQAA
jgi:hypothetical protein